MNEKSIIENIDAMHPISLTEMNGVALLKRVDTKFIMCIDELPYIISQIQDHYRILDIEGQRLMTYHSTYFDTQDKQFYFDHHNRILNRIKVRIRKYVESDISFLEVKKKNAKSQTVKSRMPVTLDMDRMTTKAMDFINEVTGKSLSLEKTLSNSFRRFTLVNNEKTERVTVDLGLSYNGQHYNPNLVIIELKQRVINRNSLLYGVLKKNGIRPFRLSKYCLGMIYLFPNLKYNHFKYKLLKINKLTA